MPVLNDWRAAHEVLAGLDSAFAAKEDTLSILLVDDGSTETIPTDFAQGPYRKIGEISILKLKKNLGHQRALAAGLCHLAGKSGSARIEGIVVMDADGQDDPSDAVRLVDAFEGMGGTGAPIIFAERTRRSESLVFRLGYRGYRFLHLVLTGRGINLGNFSLIPWSWLDAVTAEPLLWNHYAASIVGSNLPSTMIPTKRRSRVVGKSSLNYVALIIHGLSAFSCYKEIIGVRLLVLSAIILVLSLTGIVVTIGLRLFTSLYLPGWTSLFAAILLVLTVQIFTLASNFTMQMVSMRSAQQFQPRRDYVWYVDGVRQLYRRKG
jgi:glycosyltransferase involved in cell wall biosynthesis